MTGTQSNQGLSDATAREALRERCLSLVRRWQPLARSGWDHQAARLPRGELRVHSRVAVGNILRGGVNVGDPVFLVRLAE